MKNQKTKRIIKRVVGGLIMAFVWTFSILLVILDRLMLALMPWKPVASIAEISKYDYLKEAVVRRSMLYAVISLILLTLALIF